MGKGCWGLHLDSARRGRISGRGCWKVGSCSGSCSFDSGSTVVLVVVLLQRGSGWDWNMIWEAMIGRDAKRWAQPELGAAQCELWFVDF